MALADLTITAARFEVVEFTSSFLRSGRSFIMRKPDPHTSDWAFTNPLSIQVWLSIVGVLICVAIVIILISYITPYNKKLYDYGSIPPNKRSRKFFRELQDSFWFAYLAFVQQANDFNPRSLSIRIVVGSWWLFTLIMIAAYTANLTAFLTVERFNLPINTPSELLDQNEIDYGVVNNGATFDYLRTSQIEPFKSLWKNIDSNPSWLVDSSEEGRERVCNESYAFMAETITNDYYLNNSTDCKLTVIGDSIGDVGYALAFQNGSLLAREFSKLILEMKENGTIEQLQDTWDLLHTEESQSSISTSVLEVENLSGIYYLLTIGCTLGLLISLAERIWYNKKTPKLPTKCPETDLHEDDNGIQEPNANQVKANI